jgi:hypothetical protein
VEVTQRRQKRRKTPPNGGNAEMVSIRHEKSAARKLDFSVSTRY